MWKARAGWLVVQPVETEEQLPGSLLIIPDSVRQRMTQWQYEVVSSGGPGKPDEHRDPDCPSDIPEGAWIMAPQRVAFDVPEEGVILLAEREVWALIAA